MSTLSVECNDTLGQIDVQLNVNWDTGTYEPYVFMTIMMMTIIMMIMIMVLVMIIIVLMMILMLTNMISPG